MSVHTWRKKRPFTFILPFAIGALSPAVRAQPAPAWPQSVWIEAEDLAPLSGGNYSFQAEAAQTKGSWSLSGPGVAAEWTQGGESEFLSIAARADAPAGLAAGRDIEVPAAGEYVLWVRYADYRRKKEEFGVRVRQGAKSSECLFGKTAVVDEMDPMSLRWDWSFGWASARIALQKGPAHLEVYSTGPTEARRQIDCLCLTTDAAYRPFGREKPGFAAWQTLRNFGRPAPSAAALAPAGRLPQAKANRPAFLWNARNQWLDQLTKPDAERIEPAFSVDPPLAEAFIAAYAGKQPPVYSHALSGPALYINEYPAAFKTGSPFLQWLDRNPTKHFSIVLNYGRPVWPKGTTDADKQAVHANLRRYRNRFLGYVAGESIANAAVDTKALDAKIRAAKSRAEVLAALREEHTAATVTKFSDYYGVPVTPADAWADVVSCQSVDMEAFTHALANWGEKRLGHENTGNSPVLARNLAFLRGASRQFGTGLFDYQSMNLGDAGTVFARNQFFYPASSRYVLDNSYDAWSGAGVNWFLKDFLLWHIAGADAFYNEQGIDQFWKPGGNVAGDNFPVQLSPKGKTTEAVQEVAAAHPRGSQYTPVAFLLDEAHGWGQNNYQPGAFGLDPQLNPKVLARGPHDAAIRGWLDVAYYPAPETLNEPATGIRQTYVNGVFGDIFDVIVTTPGKSAVVASYPVVVAAGAVSVPTDWGQALRAYLQNGGTLLASAGELTGPGAAALALPAAGATREASSFVWKATGQPLGSNVFRYQSLPVEKSDTILATAGDGSPLCIERKVGKGRLIISAIPLGIGIDERPTPLSGLLMRHVTGGLMPVQVEGDVQWALNRLDDGGWLVTLLNNSGITKPQHGVLPTDHSQFRTATVRTAFPVTRSAEWMAGDALQWKTDGPGSSAQTVIPAGAVRMIELRPRWLSWPESFSIG